MLRDFLRRNWVYLVFPLVVVLIVLALLLVFGEDSASNFIYPIH